MSRDQFKFRSRTEIIAFLAAVNESAEIILDPESDSEARCEAMRTGPHVSHHLADIIELEMSEDGWGQDEWIVDDLSRHLTRMVISHAFCQIPLRIAGFEQLAIDMIERYEAGDYSFSPEEVRMNQKSEKMRTRHCGHQVTDKSEVPEAIMKIMELVNEMIGENAEIRLLDEDEALEMMEKRRLAKEEEEDGPI